MASDEHRTWLSCVTFLDVVGFSNHSIAEQLEIKQNLDATIREQLAGTNHDEYILLDRGDGVAVCYLGEPETAFFFAIDLRNALAAQSGERPAYDIRIGINLGPIKIIQDVNGDRAPVGDGINCAARVMDFAGANEILVSRSFYDVIGCQSQDYADLFSYLGMRADKHVRKFELFAVVQPGCTRPAGAAAGADAGQAAHPHVEPEFLERLKPAFARAIGPMADILLARATRKARDQDELLTLLGRALQDDTQRTAFLAQIGVRQPATDSAAEPAEESVPPTATASALDGALLSRAQSLLASHLGPIATLLVKQAAASATDHDDFVQRVASRITDSGERERFLTRMHSVAKRPSTS
jgi:class 3 adenylate cyclase